MSLSFTQPITACQGCDDAYVAYGPITGVDSITSSSGGDEVSDTGDDTTNCASLQFVPARTINYTPSTFTTELTKRYRIFVRDLKEGGVPAGCKWVDSEDFNDATLAAFHLEQSPVAAWGIDIPLDEGVTHSDLGVSPSMEKGATCPLPNACYEILAVETPVTYEAGSPTGVTGPQASKLKKINLAEFTGVYDGVLRGVEYNLRGGDHDESDVIGAIFTRLSGGNLADLSASYPGVNGAPYRVIIRARKPDDSIRINKVVTLYAHNVEVEFRSPIVYGESGAIRMFGEQPEVTRGEFEGEPKLKAKLAEDAESGDDFIILSDNPENMQASDFLVGDVVTLRGQNDLFGKALTKQVLHVESINVGLNKLTFAEELEFDFLVTYPGSDWVPDLTTGTTVALAAYAAFQADVSPGDMLVAVDATQLLSSGIAVGDVVLVSTNETENAINSNAHTGGGSPYKNTARLEIKKIVAKGLATVTFDSPLVDSYSTATFGGITLLSPITGSSFKGIRASYAEEQLSRNTHGIQIGYGYKCRIEDCEVDGSGGGKGNGIRVSHCLECEVVDSRVSNAAFIGSGEGYGFSAYTCDRNRFINCRAEGCRHNFLCQKANHTLFTHCTSVNDGISGFDVHGVNSINTHFVGCQGYGGPLLADDATHKSIFRVGNTSHAVGDFGTVIENCFVSQAKLLGDIASYAAIEIFGASEDISMRGCAILDCDTGIRAGYDNFADTEADNIANVILRNNSWIRVDTLSDINDAVGESTTDLDDGGLKRVSGILTPGTTTGTQIPFNNSTPTPTGLQVVSTSYTTKAPNRTVKVTLVVPHVATGTATNIIAQLFADSTCIGVSVTRIPTTGATSGTQIVCVGTFIGSGSSQTIQARVGPRDAATLTFRSHFNGFDQPFLIIEEAD